MSSKQAVLEDIRRGISPEELAEKIPWEGLNRVELGELLKASHQLHNDQQSYQLLVYLFRISSHNDLWYSVEVLAEVIHHPVMTSKDRQSILWTMRSRLDRIRDEITAAPPAEENLRKYWLMEASYYVVNGANLAETGHQAEANQNNQIAQGIFEQLGLAQPAAQLKTGSPAAPASRPGQAAPAKPAMRPAPAQSVAPGPAAPAPDPLTTRDIEPSSLPPVVPDKAPADPVLPDVTLPGAKSPPDQANPAPVETPARPPTPAAKSAPDEAKVEPPDQEDPAGRPVIYQPLPDVWLKEGQLYVQGMAADQSADARGQAEQIQRHSEILAGIQLQIQMYLERRSRLDREVKALEARAASLKTLCARMEKKIKKSAGSQ